MDQLLNRQQQVNFIAHVPASANLDDIVEKLDELFVRYKTRTKQICFLLDFISLIKKKQRINKNYIIRNNPICLHQRI